MPPRWDARERDWRRQGLLVAGVDEVGRGPLAGPVVVCALIWPPDRPVVRGVDDSKRLAAPRRAELAAQLTRGARAWALGAASVAAIDRLGIVGATTLAMRRALGRLPVRPDRVLVDGLPVRGLGWEHTAVVRGDAKCFCIAAASTVAKVARDAVMARLGARYPAYGWGANAGYGTAAHRAAVARVGLTPHHRRTFCGGCVAGGTGGASGHRGRGGVA